MDGEQQKRQGQQGAMEAQSTELITTDPLGLDSLAAKIAAEPERFANGDAELAEASRAALKRIYDASIAAEAVALPHITSLLQQYMPADDEDVRKTRSSSAVKRKRASSPPPALNNGSHGPEWHSLFEPTPLEELVLEGMGPSELWEQLELRGAKIARLIDTVVISDALNPDEDPEGSPSEEEEDEDEDEDEDDDEEDVRLDQLTDAELRAIGIDPERLDELEMDSEDEESSMGEGYAGASDLSDEDADQIVYEQLRTEKEQQARKAALEAAELSRLRGMGGEDEDEDEDEAEVDDDALLDEGEEEGGEEQQETQPSRLSRSILDSLDEPGSSTAAGVRRGPRHATLDDDFFSIDEFNRITEHQEREAARKARSSNADEDEDEDEDINDIDLFKSFDVPGTSDAGSDADMEQDVDDDADADGPDPSSIRYSDFFEPPPRSPKGGKGQKGKGKAPASPAAKDRRPPAASAEKGKEPKAANENENEENSSSRRTSVRFNDQVAVRQIKARKNAGLEITPEMLAALGEEGLDMDDLDGEEADEKMEGDEEEEDGDDDEEGMEEESDGEEYGYEEEEEEDEDGMNVDADGDSEGQETAQRVSADLFADEPSSSSASAEQLSAHERRQASLAEEIAALEAENVGKRDWTLMGEAGSRARPVNSLLEEDLEFEHTAKATPVITEETTEGLEDLIKRRILDRNFDDVVRLRNLAPTPFLPSRLLELSDSRSAKSLAELYEDDYQNARAETDGTAAPRPEADVRLEKEHKEIGALFEDICGKLDALSNAHFTPKAPTATIQTLSNLPSISMESALPTTSASSNMLAPEEVYDAGRTSSAFAGDSSELAPNEKRAAHHRRRREKKARNEKIENVRKAYAGEGARPKGGDKAEKEEALKKLVGNKGVSVIGKDGGQRKGKDALGRPNGANGKGKGASVNGQGSGNGTAGAGAMPNSASFKL